MTMEWKTLKLGELCKIVGGGTPSRSEHSYWNGGKIKWLSAKHISPQHQVTGFELITESAVKKSATHILPKGTLILVARVSIGKMIIADDNYAINQDLVGLVPFDNKTLDTKYLFYFLKGITNKITSSGRGASIKGVTRDFLGEIELPLPFKNNKPDISEQRRIADKLEMVFTKIQVSEEKVSYTTSKAKALFSSYLNKQFDDPQIEEVELGAVCIISGGFGFPHSHQGRKSEKYPFYKVSDMNSVGNEVYITNHNHSISDADVKELKVKVYPAGTIIFPKIGAAIATNKKRILSVPATVDNNVMVLVPKENVNSEYLYNHLLNLNLSDWSNKSALPSIRKSVVEKTKIPMPMMNGKPDYEMQERFASSIKKFQEKATILERLSRNNMERLQMFRQSVLEAAFQPLEVIISATKAVPVVSPIQLLPSPRMFDIQQAVAQILNRFERGEMVVAKVLYIGQEVFGVPTNIQFSAQNFGPYDTAVKKAVTAGLSPKNKFFTKKGYGTSQVLALGANSNKILRYSTSALAKKTNAYLDEMLPLYTTSDSAGIERLATICKIIEDERTVDDATVKTKLQEWKPNKFTDDEVSRTLSFIKTKGWEQKLIK